MNTAWKIIITFVVFVLFLFAAVGTLAVIGQLSLPYIGSDIAVIPIKGEITMEECGSSIFGRYECAQVSEIRNKLRDADNDPLIKAIVLDINSGGGGVVASGELMRAVKETKKPVVAYISEAGASGAYYVATGADWIIADKNAITGSIGVIMTITHYYGLYDKLGLNVTVIKAGDSKDIGSPYRPITEEEKKELKALVNKIYDDFIDNVAENRRMNKSEVRKLADGTIYLGSEAKEKGLIDEVGNINDAIKKAASLANLTSEPTIRIMETKKEESILDLLMKYDGVI